MAEIQAQPQQVDPEAYRALVERLIWWLEKEGIVEMPARETEGCPEN